MKRTENKKQGIEGMDELLQAVEMVKRGDDSYFHVIYEKTRGMALAVIRKYNRDQADHEDILQETYLKAYTHMGQLKDNARIQSWINQIAANTAITAAMKKKPTMFSEMEDEEGNVPDIEDESGRFSPEIITGRKAMTQIVTEILDTLPEDQRIALWMVYGQKITIREMAESLGISENTIKSRLYQGRKKLLERKSDFRKLGVELTIIPVSVVISCAFQESVYAAVGEGAAAAGAAASAASYGQASGTWTPSGVSSAGNMTGSGAASGTPAFAGSSSAGAANAGSFSAGSAAFSGASSAAAGTASSAAAGAAAAGMGLGVKIAVGLVCAAVVAGGGFAVKTAVTMHREAAAEYETEEEIEEIREEEANEGEEPEGETGLLADSGQEEAEERGDDFREEEDGAISETGSEGEGGIASDTAAGEDETDPGIGIETAEGSAAGEQALAVSVSIEHIYSSTDESAVISGTDQAGNVVWTYETGTYGMTQLYRISEIGVFVDTYYLVEDGAVIALDRSDGSVKWKNEEFAGGGPAFDFGSDGNLYLCGYLGPDLFVVDPDGNTVYRKESFNSDYYWPYELECREDGILLTMEGAPYSSAVPVHMLISYGDHSYTILP